MANPWEMDWTGNASSGAKPWEMTWDQPKTPTPAGERFKQGLRDPLDKGAQMLTRALPEGVVSGVNRATQFVNELPIIGPATKAIGMTPATQQQIDQGVTQRERAYVPPEGFDWMRAGGNMVSTAPLAAALPVGAAALPRIGYGAATGAGIGAVSTPVAENQDQFWQQTAEGAKGGAIGGAIAAPIVGALSRVIQPKTSPQVKTLLSEGVTPTPGQILGGMAGRAEEKLTSVPLLGDAITSAKQKSIEELNKAAYARALKPIGGKVPDEVGRTGVASVSDQLSSAYNTLLPKLSFKADGQFAADLSKIQQMAATFPPAEARQFQQALRDRVIGKLTPQGLASGETIKAIESELGKMAKGYRGDQSFDKRQLGDALGEVQNAIRQTLQRTNPAHADELAKINLGYANYARIRNAGARAGKQEGGFTPAGLAGGVRATDRSVGKGDYARGKAFMQDLSDAGVNVLGSKYPDSGSIGRLLMGAGTLGSGALNLGIPGALGVASLPYLPGGRQLMAALLARRPALAEPIANSVSRIPGGLLGPAMYPLLNE
jgi:hypothetical protein